jgi:exosortase C (VPDSG-CTERM-specific)
MEATTVQPSGVAGFLESLGLVGRRYLLTLAVITLILAQPWMVLGRGSLRDELYSYAVLIPAICVWLIRQRAPAISESGLPSRTTAALLFTAATLCASAGISAWRLGWITSETSWLTAQMGAWVLAVWGATAYHLGVSWMRRHLFALAFLSFTIPVPTPLVEALELGLQAASATASDWLFALSGTPYLRDGMAFWLPNIHILVAPECSGIRSTLVLLITGILGAHLLLRNPLHRWCVVLIILPLGVFRNALRILTLTLLSVHVNPEIMNSALHKRGGPLFFAVSLIPLFALFWWFGRRERKARTSL